MMRLAYTSTDLITYIGKLYQKLIFAQLVKKFLTICGARKFITEFTRIHHRTLSQGTSIQSIPLYPIYLRLFYFPPDN
jgi:hypothetical protein